LQFQKKVPKNFFKDENNIESRVLEFRAGKSILPEKPKISVIIPCYNNAALIAETLQTVFAQTFRDFEVVLVNDGSPDTFELEKNLEPFFEKLVYVKQENRGASAARNTGIYYSRGKYVAFLDGDDLWLSDYLEAQMKFIAETDFQMVYCDALLFGEKPWDGKQYMEKSPSSGDVTVKSLILADCNVITSGTIVEREQVIIRQGFDESAEAMRVEDFDLWIGLAKQGCRIGYQRKVLLKYRVGFTGLSGGNISRAERSVQALHLIKAKNQFTENESSAWNLQLRRTTAQLELEKGKFYLVKENFEQSLFHLSAANSYFHKKKLLFLIWLIRKKPYLVVRVYKMLRADEFDFVNLATRKTD
jgi:glycosyltransferase involved in cell wall biosynthesis